MNSKDIGDISESQVLARLILKGENVLIPFGDNKRYDLVIEKDGNFQRIQIKTGRFKNGVIIFPTCSSSTHRGGNKNNYIGQIEMFMVYCPELDTIYRVPINEIKEIKTECTLRVEKPIKNQIKGIRLAVDFEY